MQFWKLFMPYKTFKIFITWIIWRLLCFIDDGYVRILHVYCEWENLPAESEHVAGIQRVR